MVVGGFMNNKFYEIPVDWYKEFNNKFVETGMNNDNFGNVMRSIILNCYTEGG